MRTLITLIALLLISVPAFADVAVDPCEGLNTGDACTTDAGAAGTCDDSGACVAAANNTTGGTNNTTNNAPPASNNGTANNTTGSTAGNNDANNHDGHTHGDTTAAPKTEDKGCATVGASGLLPSLLVFALVFARRRW